MALRPVLTLAACIAVLAASGAGAAKGGEVTLVLRNGGLTIIGELVQSGPGSYVIKSDKFGVVSVEASKFECSGAGCPKPPASFVGIHGSNTIGAQLMPNTVERFADREGYTLEKIVGADPEEVQYKLYTSDGKQAGLFELQSHGSNTAPPDLQKGKAQLGMMSRPIKPEEVKAIADSGIKLKTHVFALDGVAVFVSPQNPVKALSLDQIAKIFAGIIKDWSEVGGSPGKIKLYARDAKSGTFDSFDNLVLKPRNLKISPEAQRFESSPDLSDETVRDPNGIGFAGFAYIRNAKALAISSECGIVSPPQVFSVKTEEYPLSRRLFLQSTPALSELGTKLLDFSLSDNAQEAISGAGFINQLIEEQSFDQQATRLAPALTVPDKEFNFASMRELVNDLKNAHRLSVTFRFPKNSATLDEKARADIPRLASFLKANAGKFTEVLLAGFTDSTGTFEGNRATAAARATSFKTALVAEGVPAAQIAVKSYGSLLPAGCNATEAGKDKNRRVEVWVKE
jgi:phosphate transport system substrate-binding protein